MRRRQTPDAPATLFHHPTPGKGAGFEPGHSAAPHPTAASPAATEEVPVDRPERPGPPTLHRPSPSADRRPQASAQSPRAARARAAFTAAVSEATS
jgi:hypothetical protein